MLTGPSTAYVRVTVSSDGRVSFVYLHPPLPTATVIKVQIKSFKLQLDYCSVYDLIAE